MNKKLKQNKKINKIVKPIKPVKLVAKYIGSIEIYFPKFKKIVNKGDLVVELPIEEAKARPDFIVIERKD